MSDDNQIPLPRSFIELFIPAGRVKPRESQAHINERHEFCEDLATMLTEHARTQLFQLGVAEGDVLERIHRGLLSAGSGVSADEAWWVTWRLAELLHWPAPGPTVVRPSNTD